MQKKRIRFFWIVCYLSLFVVKPQGLQLSARSSWLSLSGSGSQSILRRTSAKLLQQTPLILAFSTLTGISIFCLANQNRLVHILFLCVKLLIQPPSAWFTRIFGGAAGNEGLGMFSLCLDWAYVGSGGGTLGSLFTPLSTQLSLYAGCAVCIIAFCAGTRLTPCIFDLINNPLFLSSICTECLACPKLPFLISASVLPKRNTLRPTAHSQ
jgi:hypothetical protein